MSGMGSIYQKPRQPVQQPPHSLSALPEELIELIVCFAGHPEHEYELLDYATLNSISLVSRRLHRIATSCLYSCIIFNPTKTLPSANQTQLDSGWDPRNNPVINLMKRREDLARHVRKVKLVHHPQNALSGVEQSALHLLLKSLFTYLPSLSVLDASYNQECTRRGMPSLADLSELLEPGSGEVAFYKLTRVDLYMGVMHLGNVEPLFRLPKINTLNFQHGEFAANSQQVMGTSQGWDFTCPTLRNLRFDGHFLGSNFHTMSALARTCTSLESLAFRGSRSRHGDNYLQHVIVTFGICISSTLKELELWNDTSYFTRNYCNRFRRDFPSFSIYGNAPKLRHVHTDFINLVQVPPESRKRPYEINLFTSRTLQSLHLRGDWTDDEIYDALKLALWDLIMSVEDRQPQLKKIILEFTRGLPPDLEHYGNLWETSFAVRNIQFEVVPDDEF